VTKGIEQSETNATIRLYNVLEKLRTGAGATIALRISDSIKCPFSSVVEVQQAYGVGILYRMIRAADVELALVTNAHQKQTDALIRIQQMLQPSVMGAAWSDARLPSDLMVTIELTGHFVSQSVKETALPDTDIQSMHATVEEIIGAILSSDLPSELREDVVQKLNLLLSALDQYALWGIRDIQTSVEVIAGTVALNNDRFSKYPDTTARIVSVIKDVATLIQAAKLTYSFAHGAYVLASDHLRLIGGQ
jgi:hypothetical protein